jgi:hypothetical protein
MCIFVFLSILLFWDHKEPFWIPPGAYQLVKRAKTAQERDLDLQTEQSTAILLPGPVHPKGQCD